MRRYRNIDFNRLEVHHLDTDRKNPYPENLVIISKEEHKRINHIRIPRGNRYAGILELKRIGIKAPNIPELND